MVMKGPDLKALAIELKEDSRGIYFVLLFMKILDSVHELQMKIDKYLTFVICLYFPLHVSVYTRGTCSFFCLKSPRLTA